MIDFVTLLFVIAFIPIVPVAWLVCYQVILVLLEELKDHDPT